jgi:hypothetical protein
VDTGALRIKLDRDGDEVWATPEGVPALVQILQAEDKPVRLLLVELLAKSKCRSATEALAQRAVFDISDAVREAAVNALRTRPVAEYQGVLFSAMRYPWPAAAEFAAEALINLNEASALQPLIELLDEPAANEPVVAKVGLAEVKAVREMVRINHLRNCVLCHAPSLGNSDLVRGLIPDPKLPVPPTFTPQYYDNSRGSFVRADITYLRQDFAVVQPVAGQAIWPSHQRFDFVVRTRPQTADEKAGRDPRSIPTNRQRDSVLFALRELTGQDAGDTSDGWREMLREALTHSGRKQ